MRRFTDRRREISPTSYDRHDAGLGTTSLASESESLKELRPMFSHHEDSGDLDLNINPSIAPPSFLTRESEDFSLFSSLVSRSTNQTSLASDGSRKAVRRAQLGQPLQTMDVPLEVPEFESGVELAESVAEKLRRLALDLAFVAGQYQTEVANLSTTVVSIIECLKEFAKSIKPEGLWSFTSFNNGHVRRILRTYLHFYDNLLKDDAYVRLRLLLCKSFNDFVAFLNRPSLPLPQEMQKPQNYAVGSHKEHVLPNTGHLQRVMDRVAGSSASILNQNGSFLAPVARGVSPELSVLCLYFGTPQPSEAHWNLVPAIHELYDDIHVVIAQNHIEPASGKKQNPMPGFKMPFRNIPDWTSPPMSVSVSTETATRVSGTMGGFVYPKIDTRLDPHLKSYANSKFAISCGHVCLDRREGNVDYPYISSPLSVLINLYKKALASQYDKFAESEDATMLESKVAYSSVLDELDKMFPVREVKSADKRQKTELRNLPKHRFGQIIWGERTLIQAKNTRDGRLLTEKKLSDLAIIKVNKLFKCDQNYLGDDIALNEYDPLLIFENLYVRKVVRLGRLARDLHDSVTEVDSFVSTQSRDSDGNATYGGLPVFKYGSTTKFTKGFLNGIKLVYWLDGAMHSSEFVVNSCENTTAFAAGGDSGLWILCKLENVAGIHENKGLAVVGMLHSYDGEFRQFGLFSPMTEILDRLEEVTKIKWGVVGVQEKDAYSESESDLESSDTEYESLDEQAEPPID